MKSINLSHTSFSSSKIKN